MRTKREQKLHEICNRIDEIKFDLVLSRELHSDTYNPSIVAIYKKLEEAGEMLERLNR